jgi:UDP-GlcNAc:undecaprenyl-phosphate GlcNAc-1-phosphate transferase
LVIVPAVAGLAALLLCYLYSFLPMRWAPRIGLVDRPREDRHHDRPTPLGGGLAMLAALAIPCLGGGIILWALDLYTSPSWLPYELFVRYDELPERTSIALLGCTALLAAVGLVDDLRRWKPLVKFIFQVVIATGVVVLGEVRLLEMFGPAVSTPATVLWIVLITNAVNFLDNVDGLAAGVVAICAAALLAAAAAAGQLFVCVWLAMLIGLCLGFLLHNFPPAKIFMGDAGSMPLGFLLAVLSILTTYYRGEPSAGMVSLLAPLVALAVPLYDTASVITLRLSEGRSPFVGDTRHFSHRLLRRGMSPRRAVLTIYLATAATSMGAALLPHVRPAAAAVVFAQTAGIVGIIALLETAGRQGTPNEE